MSPENSMYGMIWYTRSLQWLQSWLQTLQHFLRSLLVGKFNFFHVYFPSFLFSYLSQEFLNVTLYFDCAKKYFISSYKKEYIYTYESFSFFSFEMLNFIGNGRWRIVGRVYIDKFYLNLLDLSKIIMSVLKVKVLVSHVQLFATS